VVVAGNPYRTRTADVEDAGLLDLLPHDAKPSTARRSARVLIEGIGDWGTEPAVHGLGLGFGTFNGPGVFSTVSRRSLVPGGHGTKV
jgi:hypothetical protein